MAPIPLLLLHSALGSSAQFEGLAGELGTHFDVHRLNFEGHGDRVLAQRSLRIEHFAENVLEYLAARAIPQIHIFGYSMGGYVALYLARQSPERVRRLATFATKLAWSTEVAQREVKFLDASQIRAKVPAFADMLAKRHTAAGFEAVLRETAAMLSDLGARPRLSAEDFANMETPIRLLVGDRDETVSIEETLEAYRQLRASELEVIPGAAHALESIHPARLSTSLLSFFAADF